MDKNRETVGPYAKLGTKFTHNISLKDENNQGSFLERFALSEIGSSKSDKDMITNRLLTRSVPLTQKESKQSNKQRKKNVEQEKKPLSATEKRESGIYNIPKDCQKYDLFLPLNELWKQYISDLCQGQIPSRILQKLLRADFHGSILTITKSTSPNLIGLSGIVAQETKNAFLVITKQDRLITLPKAGSVFSLQIQGTVFLLFGNQLLMRASERAVKKLKPRPTVEL
ncbi:RNase P/RNase MRP complex subunit [Entomophthora muscae]|uniref:RNase P/RNase MRP complex subunit n=1 Tax=Entomophthora muscae TaxID=34485 RepID=A0ACC2UMG8_9FUNG|nr:RNase P/RNase MRP complex subunit [Entomophthora muscae]